MTVTVNGKPHDYADGATVADVILDITGHAHDDDQLGLVVDELARQVDARMRSGQGRRELREDDEVLGIRQVRLVRVVAVVQPDREDLARVRHRRVQRGRGRQYGRRGQWGQRGRRAGELRVRGGRGVEPAAV